MINVVAPYESSTYNFWNLDVIKVFKEKIWTTVHSETVTDVTPPTAGRNKTCCNHQAPSLLSDSGTWANKPVKPAAPQWSPFRRSDLLWILHRTLICHKWHFCETCLLVESLTCSECFSGLSKIRQDRPLISCLNLLYCVEFPQVLRLNLILKNMMWLKRLEKQNFLDTRETSWGSAGNKV